MAAIAPQALQCSSSSSLLLLHYSLTPSDPGPDIQRDSCFLPAKLSHSLSLSLTHTHTHTLVVACTLTHTFGETYQDRHRRSRRATYKHIQATRTHTHTHTHTHRLASDESIERLRTDNRDNTHSLQKKKKKNQKKSVTSCFPCRKLFSVETSTYSH